MKTSTIITAGLAALAATPTLTNGVASCPDGHFVPVSPPVTQGHGKVVIPERLRGRYGRLGQ